jgi:hypothetical protein
VPRRVQELGLLSKVQELGVLSKLEKSGLTLSKIEESGLLTTLEKSGVLGVAADKCARRRPPGEVLGGLGRARGWGGLAPRLPAPLTAPRPPAQPPRSTPGTLSAVGYVLVAAAAAVVYFAPDETTGQLVAQAVGAAALALGGAAALVGAGFLADLQKVE